jgi:hypothetical protein
MKFTSIVFAALVAATQFSSTFALSGVSNEGAADTEKTYEGTAVTIDVSANDNVQDGSDNDKLIADALKEKLIVSYDLKIGSTTTAKSGVVTIKSGVPGTKGGNPGTPDKFVYTPNAGFTGTDIFGYTFLITQDGKNTFGNTAKDSVEVDVTVTVSPTVIKQTFEIPGLVSSGDAVKYNHVGLSNIAAFTPAAPDMDSFTAIVKPVFGGSADFAANTSTEVVQQNFSTIFNSFYNFFRGGN